MSSLCYIDGRITPLAQATIPVDDLGFQRGYGVFDFMRTYGGKLFRARQHLDRLRGSASLVGLACPWPPQELMELIHDLLKQSQLAEANVRLIISGGSSPDFMTPSSQPRLVIIVSPIQVYPQVWYQEGICLALTKRERLFPQAKSINYLAAVSGLMAARKKGAPETLLVDESELVREGDTTNVFAVINKRLVTPAVGILPGITRGVILELARDRIETEERKLFLSELYEAAEVFVTATNKEVVPVVRIGDRVIGSGRPGQVTRELMEAFRELTSNS